MSDKHVRGELLVFVAMPKDPDGNSVSPTSVKLYLNYKHADGTTSTDAAINMDQSTDGIYDAEFDTKVCEAGLLSWSIRTASPASAVDGKITITANAANPEP